MKEISKENSIFYRFNSSLQKRVAKKILLNLEEIIITTALSCENKVKILEIGAGSGNLTIPLLKKIYTIAQRNIYCNFDITITEPNDHFLAILLKEIEVFKKLFNKKSLKIKLSVEQKEFEYFFNSNDQKFDITISNFVYHWVENFNFLFNKYYNFSTYHVFSIPIDESFDELKKRLKENDIILSTNQLPSQYAISETLNKINHREKKFLVINKYKIYKNFDNIFDILKFFKKSGYSLRKTNTLYKLQDLKKIKQIQDGCKMEFIYLKVVLKV